MKKLTLKKGKAMAYLALLCLFLAQSCRKDGLMPNASDLKNGISIAEARQYFESNLQQFKNSKKLMSTGSGAQNSGLTNLEALMNNKKPRWDKAYQSLISTGSAVKIPLDFGSAMAIVGSKKQVIPFSSLNYLYMYKDSASQIHAEWVILKPDSAWLYGNRESYRGNIYIKDWDGKHLKTLSFSPHASTKSIAKTAIRTSGKIMSTSNEPTLGENGYTFCIRFKSGVCTCQGGPCDWLTCNVCGRTACANDISIWVIEDIFGDPTDGPSGPGGTGDSPSPNPGIGGGGSPNPNDYTPGACDPSPDYVYIEYPDGSSNLPPCPPIPQDPPPPTAEPVSVQQFLKIGLDIQPGETELNNFIDNPANLSKIQALSIYFVQNGGATSENNVSFVKWAMEHLIENTDILFSELVEANNIPNSTINLPNLIDTTGLSPYPSFKTIVSSMPSFLNEHPEVIASLSRYTGFSKTKIMQLMQPGKGPKIELVSNLNDNGNPAFGQYIQGTNTLRIKKELVVGLDKVQSPNRYAAIGMLLAIVTLHEFVHYGRDVNKLTRRIKINGTSYESGLIFELSISPTNNYNYIDRNNAIEWVKFYNFSIND